MYTSLITSRDGFGRKRLFRSSLEAGFLTNGLLAHWPLTATATVNDVVHGYLATTGNMSWSADGVTPAAGEILFPAFSDIAGLNVAGDFTVSFWYRMSDHGKQRILITEPSNEWEMYVDFWDNSFRARFLGVTTSRGDLEWDFADGENSAGDFRMMVLTKIGGDVYIYRNAELLASGEATTTMPDYQIKLGTYSYDTTGGDMYGRVRDLKIYNQGKTLSQVQALYAAGEPGSGPVPNAGLIFRALLDVESATAVTGQSLVYSGIDSGRLAFTTYESNPCARFQGVGGIGGWINTPEWTTGLAGSASRSICFWASPNLVEYSQFMPCAGYGTLRGTYLGVTRYDGYIRTMLFVSSNLLDEYEVINGPVIAGDSAWHHFAAVLSADDDTHATIYIDDAAYVIEIPYCLSEDAAVFIGQHGSYGNYFYEGALRDVRIYNRTLSGAEISAIMQE